MYLGWIPPRPSLEQAPFDAGPSAVGGQRPGQAGPQQTPQTSRLAGGSDELPATTTTTPDEPAPPEDELLPAAPHTGEFRAPRVEAQPLAHRGNRAGRDRISRRGKTSRLIRAAQSRANANYEPIAPAAATATALGARGPCEARSSHERVRLGSRAKVSDQRARDPGVDATFARGRGIAVVVTGSASCTVRTQ